MSRVTGTINKEHYQTVIRSVANQILADEPITLGGMETGFSPDELLASALASCTCITLRMYADRKNWDLESARVEVTFYVDKETKTTQVDRVIHLVGNLDTTRPRKTPVL